MKPRRKIALSLTITLILNLLLQAVSVLAQTPRAPQGRQQERAQPQRSGKIIGSFKARSLKRQRLDEQDATRPVWVNEALQRSLVQLENRKEKLHLKNVNDELGLLSAVQDDLKQTHLRLAQMYNGVEVFGGQVLVRVQNESATETGGRAFELNELETQPALTAEEAIEAAKKALAYEGEFATLPTAKLVVLPNAISKGVATQGGILTWQVSLSIEDGTDKTAAHQYFINAQDGTVAWHYDALPHDGTGYSLYSGTVAVPSVYVPPAGLFASQYRMQDNGRGGSAVYNMNGSTSSATGIFLDSDNVWGDGTLGFNQTAAVDAQFGVARAWDYFANVLGRRGMNGNGGAITSRVHYGSNYNNAFKSFNSDTISFGDGDGSSFSPLITLDIAAHEFTHGVTEHTAGLIYAGESGALNESFSDIFGTATEFAYGQNPNYLIGEACYTPGVDGDALRDMANPTISSYGSRLYQGACTPDDTNDNCGVHTNSGIMNNVFYLLAVGGTHAASGIEVSSIGRRNAEAIFYRALSLYLFPSATFYDARVATVNAAVDFFGPDSREHRAVEAAWEAVGVSAPHLLFYNAQNGSGALVQVTTDGFLNQFTGYGAGTFSQGWTDIVPTRGHQFFYNWRSGLYAVTKVDQDGNIATLSHGYLPAYLTKVVSTDNSIFCWNGATLGGLIGQVNASGQFITTQTFGAGAFSPWTDILDTAYGMFFYHRYTGTVAVGYASRAGRFVQTFGQAGALPTGYDKVVVQGANLLLYNSVTGGYAAGYIASDGKFYRTPYSSCGSLLQAGYREIVAIGRTLFFYNPDNGAAAVGSFLSGRFVLSRCQGQLDVKQVYGAGTFGIGWTNLVATANGLFFYNWRDGSAAVGNFAGDGSFVQTAGYGPGSLSLNWSHIVTTEK